jgi:CubicO group peptidase (beta-lactamase class C family)
MPRSLFRPGVALACLLALATALPAATFPGRTWEVAGRPEDRGFSSAKLAAAQAYARTIHTAAFILVHDGVVVTQWGEVDRKFNTHSLRKSFLALLYGAPVRAGTIHLEATIGGLGIDDVLGLSEEEKRATVRDVLKARSGVYHPALYETAGMKALKPARHSVRAGTHWYYNNWDFNVAGTIYAQRTGRDLFAAIEEDIARPIGMEDFTAADGTYVTGAESVHQAYPFRITARDLARFGLLALRRGEWNGRRVIDAAWVDECVRYHSDAALSGTSGYGYMWWVARDFNRHPHLRGAKLPEGSYSARGARGHSVLVIPDYQLVLVHRVNTDQRGQEVTSAQFGRLVQRVLDARLATPKAGTE